MGSALKLRILYFALPTKTENFFVKELYENRLFTFSSRPRLNTQCSSTAGDTMNKPIELTPEMVVKEETLPLKFIASLGEALVRANKEALRLRKGEKEDLQPPSEES